MVLCLMCVRVVVERILTRDKVVSSAEGDSTGDAIPDSEALVYQLVGVARFAMIENRRLAVEFTNTIGSFVGSLTIVNILNPIER